MENGVVWVVHVGYLRPGMLSSFDAEERCNIIKARWKVVIEKVLKL